MRVLFLDLDTLRPDHLGCYGYHRNTSPTIDKIAAQGVRFNQYYCSDAPCLPSRAALMTGQFGTRNGVVNHMGTAADVYHDGAERKFRDRLARESLPAVLRRKDYHTVTISPFAERHASWTFYAGFKEVHNTGRGGAESAEEITPTVLKWIKQNAKSDNWFLHVNYWDPHTPYRAPLSFGNPFENDPLPPWFTEELIQKHRQMVGPHCAREIAMYDNSTDPQYPRHPGEIKDMRGLRAMIDGYDTGILYMDSHIDTLLNAFREEGVLDDLAIIISADHGENFGELGIYGEHATADGITPRIPMIMKFPGCQQGIVDNALHYNVDLLPTLKELLDIGGDGDWDGISYADTLRTGRPCGRDYLVLTQCAHVCQRGVRFDDYIYIRTYHDGYHLFPKEMLFDLKNDPFEENNLAPTRPDLCQKAAALLLDWHDEVMKKSKSAVDPLWTVMREGGPGHAKGKLKKYCEYLEKTDRGWAVPELQKRHPGEFV